MEIREVTHVRRNDDGDITALCHPGEPWSPREKEDAIDEIENKRYEYYVLVNGVQIPIDVVHKTKGFYLRTIPDGEVPHNLHELPKALDSLPTIH